MSGLFDDADLLSTYPRAQALEDGVLVDLTPLAREAGFRFSLAVTQGVWALLEPGPALKAEGQDWQGRAWDLLMILKLAIRRAPTGADRVEFAPLFVLEPGGRPAPVRLWSLVGPGDAGEPVITVLLEGED